MTVEQLVEVLDKCISFEVAEMHGGSILFRSYEWWEEESICKNESWEDVKDLIVEQISFGQCSDTVGIFITR